MHGLLSEPWHQRSAAEELREPASAASVSSDSREICETVGCWCGSSPTRFYGTPGVGPSSHFYTLNPNECEIVRRDRGWTFENYAFFAFTPLAATYLGSRCPQSMIPIYRLYNNGFASGDSNHRYTANVSTYKQMMAQGWSDEGIAFCATTQ